jgi:16S rRNA (guanine527-N7)-methyltransferase
MKYLISALPDGVVLSDEQVQAFRRYAELLTTWNERINLTAITDDYGIQVRHFADSLSVAAAADFTQPLTLADLGSGGGFPGLPLKIAFPQLDVTLVDSVSKKVRFMEEVIGELALAGARTVDARIETVGQQADHREAFDVVTARAVAYMPVLAEYMLPLCKVGGLCVAMKGDSAQREAGDAANAFAALGGALREIKRVDLPGVEEGHYLIVIEKLHPTPEAYPRRIGKPAKSPL